MRLAVLLGCVARRSLLGAPIGQAAPADDGRDVEAFVRVTRPPTCSREPPARPPCSPTASRPAHTPGWLARPLALAPAPWRAPRAAGFGGPNHGSVAAQLEVGQGGGDAAGETRGEEGGDRAAGACSSAPGGRAHARLRLPLTPARRCNSTTMGMATVTTVIVSLRGSTNILSKSPSRWRRRSSTSDQS